jgi:SAM-dependent methyltransferase
MREFEHPVTLWDHFKIAMVRDFPPFFNTHIHPGQTFVQLGPGEKIIEPGYHNWVNLDWPEWDADDPLPFQDETVAGICTYHSMDHFPNPTFVLAEVQRVLKPRGWFVNVVPHYSSQLANECIDHKTRWGTDTWRNILTEHQYKHGMIAGEPERWKLKIGFNMIMGLTERNVVLVTQLIKGDLCLSHETRHRISQKDGTLRSTPFRPKGSTPFRPKGTTRQKEGTGRRVQWWISRSHRASGTKGNARYSS